MYTRTFPTAEAFFEALLGPASADAHVTAWKREQWLARMEAGCKAGAAALEAHAIKRRELRAQEIAANHNFNPTTLRAALHRYEFGCFSNEAMAPTQTAIHRRALDIALEHADRMAA